MAKTYYTVLTTYGSQLFAQAMANRQQVRITQFAVGDGNGRAVQPDSARTSLVRQVHRANISAVSPDPRNNKQVIFELTIPENVGGFWIREMGIYDNNNRLVAYANCPDTYKPQLSEGSGKIQVVRMILLVSSSNAVTLSVDDSVIFVTRGQLTPKTITATSQNGVDETGHSHQIDQASTTRKGITQLTNDTGLDSETLALTAKAGKALSQRIAQNQQGIAGLNSNKVDKTAISNSVNSTSQTNAASSQAVKTAYDKGVEAKNAADAAQRTANAKQSPATSLAGYGITDAIEVQPDNKNTNLNGLLGLNAVWGTAGRSRNVTHLPSSMYDYGVGLALNASGARAMLYIPHSDAGTNSGVWVQSSYASNDAQPFWRRIDGTEWADIRNPVNASTTRRGLAQYTDNVNFDSSDWGASAKALRTVNLKAVAAKEAADTAQRTANAKQSPATSLAGYGITDAIEVQADNKNTNLNGLLGLNAVWGTAGNDRHITQLPSSMYDYGVGLALNASGARAMLYIPHSDAGTNSGVWVQSSYASNNAPPFWRRIDGTEWADIRNPVNASTTRRGLAQYTDNVNFDSSDWGASAKALRTVNLKAVAAKEAADAAQRTANAKQSPATTLAGYGITDFKVQTFSGNLNLLRTDGFYSINSSSQSQNLPIQSSGHLIVVSGGDSNKLWCRQIFKRHYSKETYERWQVSADNNNWSEWVRTDGDFDQLLNKNGWTKLPNGLIIQWGVLSPSYETTADYSFNITFPNQCFCVVASCSGFNGNEFNHLGVHRIGSSGNGFAIALLAKAISNAKMRIYIDDNLNSTDSVNWIAIGR